MQPTPSTLARSRRQARRARTRNAHSCTPTSAREDTYSTVFRRRWLYSLYSYPLVLTRCSEYTAQDRLPALMLVSSPPRHGTRVADSGPRCDAATKADPPPSFGRGRDGVGCRSAHPRRTGPCPLNAEPAPPRVLRVWSREGRLALAPPLRAVCGEVALTLPQARAAARRRPPRPRGRRARRLPRRPGGRGGPPARRRICSMRWARCWGRC